MENQKLSPFQIWMLAARPKTLPAAAAPVITGTAVAIREGVFSPGPAMAALLGALLIQIGTNFANDVFDYKKGADTTERLGPVRVTQAGLLKPEQVMAGMWITFGLAALVGLYLLFVAGWPVVWIGLFSILAGIAYTGGPFPLGYNGLGDIFVFIFFGLVAVCGTYFVQSSATALSATALSATALSATAQAGIVSTGAVWAAIPMGLLATAILVVNNLRDIETDSRAGKKTLAVRFGANAARIEYDLMVGGALLCPLLMWLTGNASPWVLLTWLTLYRAIPLIQLIHTEKGKVLNKGLAGTGRMELEFAVLLAAGLVIESFLK